jgi:hypothetical protein
VNRWKNESKNLKEELRKVYNSWKEDRNKANCLELQNKKLSKEKDNMSENLKSIKLEMRKTIEIFSQEKLELTENLDQERRKNISFQSCTKDNNLKKKCQELETMIDNLKAENVEYEKRLKNPQNQSEQNVRFF